MSAKIAVVAQSFALTKTGIHEFQKKWSLNAFSIKPMQKYPQLSSHSLLTWCFEKVDMVLRKCENDC